MVNEPSVFEPSKFYCITGARESDVQIGRQRGHVQDNVDLVPLSYEDELINALNKCSPMAYSKHRSILTAEYHEQCLLCWAALSKS